MRDSGVIEHWSFRCGGGHEHGPFRSEEEARLFAAKMGRSPADEECWPCPAAGAEFTSWSLRDPREQILVQPHFTPHFNLSLGEYIESRDHFERRKLETGTTEVVLKKKKRGGTPDFIPTDFTERATPIMNPNDLPALRGHVPGSEPVMAGAEFVDDDDPALEFGEEDTPDA